MGCQNSKNQTTTKAPPQSNPKGGATPGPVDRDTVKIVLTLLSAKGLCPTDEGGTSDPYCQFLWRGKEYKTTVEYKTLNPEWATTIHLYYNPKLDDKKFTLTCLDYDKTLWDELAGENPEADVLGSVDIDLSQCIDTPDKKEYTKTVDLKGKIATGNITYKISGEPIAPGSAPVTQAPPPPKAPGTKPNTAPIQEGGGSEIMNCIEIQVIECRGLRAADKDGKADPYITVHWRGKKYETSTQKKTINPVFNEVIQLQYTPNTDPREVEIDVFDYDFGRKNEFLGNCTIDLSDHKLDQAYLSEVKLSGPKAQGSIVLKTKIIERKPKWPDRPKIKFVKCKS